MILDLWDSVNNVEDGFSYDSCLNDSLNVWSKPENHHHTGHKSYQNRQKLSHVILFIIIARIGITFFYINRGYVERVHVICKDSKLEDTYYERHPKFLSVSNNLDIF